MPLRYAMEFHDSVYLDRFLDMEGNLCLRLKAVIHESENEPGFAPGKIYQQEMLFILRDPVIKRDISKKNIWVSDGSVTVSEKQSHNLLSLPFRQEGEINVSLVLAWQDEVLTVTCTALILVESGPRDFMQDFQKQLN